MTSERQRLFVALDLPDGVRRALAGWAARAAPDGVRRVSERNLHVTLAFLGSRSPEEAAAVAALLPVVAAPIGELRTADAQWLPSRRPSVLTVALVGTAKLEGLQASVADALADSVGYKSEHRRFRPHVTVGRVRRGTRMRAGELPEAPPSVAFAADGLTLYRSHADPGGSRYEPLARARL